VVKADQHVPRGVLLERAIERREPLRAKAPFAVRGVGEPGIEEDDHPAPECEAAADLKRRMRQPPVELVGKVMIPRDQQDRGSEGRKGELQESVALWFVLDEIAGDENRIRRQKSPVGVGDTGLERLQRAHATHQSLRIGQQVRIRELHEPGSVFHLVHIGSVPLPEPHYFRFRAGVET
jgi:hypothetical protein